MIRSNEYLLFSCEPQQENRWGSFAASFGFQALAVALVTVITFGAPQIIKHQYQYTALVAPSVTEASRPAPQPARLRIAIPSPRDFTDVWKSAVVAPTLPMPKVFPVPPQVETPSPTISLSPRSAASTALNVTQTDIHQAPRLERQIANSGFGSSAPATITSAQARAVQTGGFGDPNGVHTHDNGGNGRATIAPLGSFDLPGGPGNGTGGAHGARGTIAGSGFGTGIERPAVPGRSTGHVRATDFSTQPTTPARKLEPVQSKPALTPVEIQNKPVPLYPNEARNLHIEGEVLLQVVFSADGRVTVTRVIRGLGHGLDEAAIDAAQRIRFVPARRDGSSVDSSATLHFVFQLS